MPAAIHLHNDTGVEQIDIDVPSKKVVVKGTASSDEILAAIKKTGKETTLVA